MSSEERSPPRRWCVVVVVDDVDDRARLCALLREGAPRAYDIVEAGTGAAGVEAILRGPTGLPDCAILDSHLPDASGAEVLEELRGPDGEVVCPVVFVTGSDGYELGRRLLRAGAQDFIGKSSMTAESVTRAVENAIERWQILEEQRTHQLRLQQLAAAVPQPVWMIEASGRLLYANARWREYFDQEWESWGGLGWGSVVHPEDVEAVGLVSRARAAGVPYTLDVRLRRFDGAYRWHQVNVVPVREPGGRGEIAAWYGVNTDIHERKEAETRLRLALQASSTGIWTWDVRSDAVTWTPECYAIHGLAEGEFDATGAGFFRLVHPADRARVEALVRSAVAKREVYRAEFRIV